MRRWEARDAEPFVAFYADADASKFVGGPIEDPDQAWQKMAEHEGHWSLVGFGNWAVEDKESGELAGCVGLWKSPAWPEHELGYWIRPTFQGRGYAQEAGREALHVAREIVKLPSLVSYVSAGNEASRRTASRLGAVPDGEIELLSFGIHTVYRHRV